MSESNDIPGLQVGHILKLYNFEHHGPGAAFAYKTRRGRQFVALLLGTEARDGSHPLDPEEVLRSLGWTPPAKGEDG